MAFVRQLREATRSRLLEIPAGTIEPGEEPLVTARRSCTRSAGSPAGRGAGSAGSGRHPASLANTWTSSSRRRWSAGLISRSRTRNSSSVRWPAADVTALLPQIEDAKTLAGLLLYLTSRATSGAR